MKNRNSFCKGILCNKGDRKYNCNCCHIWVCSLCSIKDGKKIYCKDCYFKSFIPDWDKLNREFEEILNPSKKLIKDKTTFGYKRIL